MPNLRLLAVVALLSLGVVIGCHNDNFYAMGFGVQNDLARTVRISYLYDGAESALPDQALGDVVEPGKIGYFGIKFASDTGCNQGTLLARDTETQEIVARILPPLCGSRQTQLSKWVGP